MSDPSKNHTSRTEGNAGFSLVIPAAGRGMRMRAVDPSRPKELLPVGQKPAIQYALEECVDAGIAYVIIIISSEKESIRRYFDDRRFRQGMFPDTSADLERLTAACTLTFVYQEEPLGEADALGLAREHASGRHVAVIYPDNIHLPGPGVLRSLRRVYEKYGQDVVALAEATKRNAFGVSGSGRVRLAPVEPDLYRVQAFHSKAPTGSGSAEGSDLRTCGMVLFGPHLFEYIERARADVEEGEFSDLYVARLIAAEKGLLGYCIGSDVFDIGHPESYKKCLAYVADALETRGETRE